ncbi:hypothetical protein ACG83_10955 [Frankia sp. R43]|uniref:hypothetical protein n=1 Tax=Frankia sp. R43 TaxID=269536 RepID=UPI0006CA3C4D|nr:hypothetical protein [Frankia sp. R43]KPM55784.1 hypothetical protein ACG83_10955 [Frankia sp. R43]
MSDLTRTRRQHPAISAGSFPVHLVSGPEGAVTFNQLTGVEVHARRPVRDGASVGTGCAYLDGADCHGLDVNGTREVLFTEYDRREQTDGSDEALYGVLEGLYDQFMPDGAE